MRFEHGKSVASAVADQPASSRVARGISSVASAASRSLGVCAILASVATTATTAHAVEPGSPVPAESRQDVNPDSATYQQPVSPADFAERISLWFFTPASCATCLDQLGYLDDLKKELNDDGLRIGVVGIVESATPKASLAGAKQVPWLDGTDPAYWLSWGASGRRLYLVDGTGTLRERIDLAMFDLALPANVDELEYRIENIAFD